MTTNDNVKQYIKNIYTPKEYIKTITYIEPENFDIKKVIPKIGKKNNNWIKISFLYKYSETAIYKLAIKSNYSEFNCKYEPKYNFLININLEENTNLKSILHKLDVLGVNFIKDKYNIENNKFYTFASHVNNNLDVASDMNISAKWLKCKPTIKNGVSDTKVTIYNSKTKINKELENGKQLEQYNIYTDVQSEQFKNMVNRFTKKDNYGGYNARYIIQPEINIGIINDKQGYYSSFKTLQVEIKHSKSNIQSIIDKDEITISNKYVTSVMI